MNVRHKIIDLGQNITIELYDVKTQSDLVPEIKKPAVGEKKVSFHR